MGIFTSQQQRTRTWLIVIGVVILLIVIIVVIFGVSNIFKIILFLAEAVLFLAVLFGVAYLFYYLFIKKHKFDPTWVNKQKLIDAGKKCNLQNLKGLYLSGDKGHSRVYIGKVAGYCRIQVLMQSYQYEKAKTPEGAEYQKVKMMINASGEQEPDMKLEKIEQDVIMVRPKGILSIFTDPMVIRVEPNEHDELVGDITLYGYSLIPISEYWFINTDYLDVKKIDDAILREAHRGVMFKTLSDMGEVVQRAIGLDSRHKKGIEEKALYEIPEMQQTQRR